MNTATHKDTYDHFIGSGALDWPWYQDEDEYAEGTDLNGWWIRFVEYSDNGPVLDSNGRPLVHTLNHAAIMRAVRQIVRTENRPSYVGPKVVKECQNFLFDRENTDFDADTADQVMQLAAFGEIKYS